MCGPDCPGHCVTRAVTAQLEGQEEGAACEAWEPAQIHPMAGMLKDCAAFGEFTVNTQKREELELNIMVQQDGLKQSLSKSCFPT